MKNLNALKNRRVLVIGDIILDEYIKGDIERISPEAPVPVLLERKRYLRLGGAANVALNIKSLESESILIGILGRDENAANVKSLLDHEGIKHHMIYDNRPTTVKKRFIAKGQQVLRVDKESSDPLSDTNQELLLKSIQSVLKDVDAVILQDYDKGIFSPTTLPEIIALINKADKPIYVDPKINNFYHYKNITLLKPNLVELKAAKIPGDTIAEKLVYLRDHQNITLPIVTRAEDGISILKNVEVITIPTQRIEVIDVSGAGDSSLSTIVLAHLAGYSLEDIGRLSNIAGGIVCRKQGVSTVSIPEIEQWATKLLRE